MPVGEQTVDVPAGGDATVRFTHRFQSAGGHAICVRAPGDRLDVDNSRWLVVPVREEVRVLCVAGREGAAKYVSDALNPNPAGESPIRPVVISEGDFADVALAEFDCVFLCNVAQLTASEAERLIALRRGRRRCRDISWRSRGRGELQLAVALPEGAGVIRISFLFPPTSANSLPSRNSVSIRLSTGIRSWPRFAVASGPGC